MRNFGKCAETSNDPVKVFEERRSKITFRNQQRRRILKVDVECLNLKGKSCDGLFIELENGNIEHFVELKGNKVFDGIKQIQDTIVSISSDPRNQIKHSYVISTRSPKIDTSIQNIKKNFRRNYNSTLTFNTGHFTKNI